MLSIPKDFLKTRYLTILRYSGLWPPVEKRFKGVYMLIFVLFFFSFSAMENITAVIQIFITRSQFKETVVNIGILVLPLISTMRVIHFHMHIDDCREIVHMLERKSFNFGNFFNFNNVEFEKYRRLKGTKEFATFQK